MTIVESQRPLVSSRRTTIHTMHGQNFGEGYSAILSLLFPSTFGAPKVDKKARLEKNFESGYGSLR